MGGDANEAVVQPARRRSGTYVKLRLQIDSPAPVVHIVVDPAQIFLPYDEQPSAYKIHGGLASLLHEYPSRQDIVWYILRRMQAQYKAEISLPSRVVFFDNNLERE